MIIHEADQLCRASGIKYSRVIELNNGYTFRRHDVRDGINCVLVSFYSAEGRKESFIVRVVEDTTVWCCRTEKEYKQDIKWIDGIKYEAYVERPTTWYLMDFNHADTKQTVIEIIRQLTED
jgi:hypothetical protein